MTESLPLLQVDDLCFAYAATDGLARLPVLTNISLRVAPQEIVAIAGPSGCGKTTLLQLLAGLIPLQRGTIRTTPETISRAGGTWSTLVLQELGLFYWMTTLDNLTVTLRVRGVPKSQRTKQAEELLAEMGLAGFERHFPHQLSGGMRQRLALARGLATAAPLILLDEPFSHLDPGTDERLEEDFLRRARDHKLTVVMVSHDVRRILRMADRVVVMGPRPAGIRGELYIDLERPRQGPLVYSPRFVALEQQVCQLLSPPFAG